MIMTIVRYKIKYDTDCGISAKSIFKNTSFIFFLTIDFRFYIAGLEQGLLNRWTSQLDLECTTGGLERVVSVHNST